MSDLLDVGSITGFFGVNGWLRVCSQTEPADNLFSYRPWLLKTKHGVKSVECYKWRPHGKNFVVQISGICNFNYADSFSPIGIVIEKKLLSPLDKGDFYWYQLEGLRVISHFEGQFYDFGIVKKILPTGANDVLVIIGDEQSIDQTERLVPYLPNRFVHKVDLRDGIIYVNWNPKF